MYSCNTTPITHTHTHELSVLYKQNPTQTAIISTVYTCISVAKFTTKSCPKSYGGELYPRHKIKKFFDDAVYNDDGEDYADLHCIWYKSSKPLIHGSMISDYIWTRFFFGGGDLYARIYGTVNNIVPLLVCHCIDRPIPKAVMKLLNLDLPILSY